MSLNLCTDEPRKRIDALQNTINDCDKMCKDIISENKQDIGKILLIASQSASNNFDRIYSLFESLSLKEDINTIKQLCDQGLSEVRNKEGNTCMLHAIYKRNHSLVQTMIKCGCNRDEINNDGNNALLLASMWCQSDTVRYLISIGFDKDWINQKSGMNALLYASLHGHLEIVKYLVSIGCDPNYKDKDGQNAILWASYYGYLETVKYLVSIGCDAKLCDKNGHNSIHIAASAINPGFFKYIYSRTFKTTLINEDTTIAVDRLANEHIDTIKYLVSIGCDPNLSDKNGLKAIHIASANGNIELIKYLISIGCDVNSLYFSGGNAIHIACVQDVVERIILDDDRIKEIMVILLQLNQKKRLNTIKYLVSVGCDANLIDKNGRNAIKIASYFGCLEIVKYLVSIGCDANLIDKDGSNAIYEASFSGNLELVKYLVSIGCDANLIDKNGNNAILWALFIGNLEIVKYLVSIGCDINFKSRTGESLLHAAVHNNHVDIIKYLLEKGLDINECNKDGITPLEYAIVRHQVEAAEFLISHGAQISKNLLRLAKLEQTTNPRYNEIHDILIRAGVCSDCSRESDIHEKNNNKSLKSDLDAQNTTQQAEQAKLNDEISRLFGEIEANEKVLKQSMVDKDKKTKNAQATIDSLEEHKNASDKELEDAKKAQEDEQSALNDQMAKLRGEIVSKEIELEHSDNVRSDQPNIASLQARLDDLNKQIAAKQSKNDEISHKAQALADAIEAKKKELEAMPNVEDKSKELEAALSDLNKQLFDKKRHNQGIERKNKSLENAISRMKGYIASIPVVFDLSEDLEPALESLNTQLEEKKQKYDNINRKNKELEDAVAQKKEELNSFQEPTDRSSELEPQLSALKNELEAKKEKNNVVERKNKALEAAIKKKKNEIASIPDSADNSADLQSTLDALNKELESKKQKNDDNANMNKALEDEITAKKAELESIVDIEDKSLQLEAKLSSLISAIDDKNAYNYEIAKNNQALADAISEKLVELESIPDVEDRLEELQLQLDDIDFGIRKKKQLAELCDLLSDLQSSTTSSDVTPEEFNAAANAITIKLDDYIVDHYDNPEDVSEAERMKDVINDLVNKFFDIYEAKLNSGGESGYSAEEK